MDWPIVTTTCGEGTKCHGHGCFAQNFPTFRIQLADKVLIFAGDRRLVRFVRGRLYFTSGDRLGNHGEGLVELRVR